MESNGRSGHYVTQLSGYKAFIPHSLPPKPDIVIDGEMWNLLSIGFAVGHSIALTVSRHHWHGLLFNSSLKLFEDINDCSAEGNVVSVRIKALVSFNKL